MLGLGGSSLLKVGLALKMPAAVVRLNALALIPCQPNSLPPFRRRMAESGATNGHVPELQDEPTPIMRQRKVIEHVALFQMKEDLTEEQEKDMLDHLYTLQYQLRGILAVSLGCINGENPDSYTHALFTRFPSKETLSIYYDSPVRWKILNEYIIPHYHGLICVDFEAEVEDDIIPIFRRGEDFEQGVEYMVFLQVKQEADPDTVHMAFHALSGLVEELGSLVVQHTSGTNFCSFNKVYTHGMVTRFPSEEAKAVFIQHPSYLEIMNKKFHPISNKILAVDYDVSPVGTTSL